MLDELSSLPETKNYSPQDRYRDFHRVFLDSDEGQRVLREILSWGGIFLPPVLGSPIDPYRTHILLGQRNIALKLMDTIYKEPLELPSKQKRKI